MTLPIRDPQECVGKVKVVSKLSLNLLIIFPKHVHTSWMSILMFIHAQLIGLILCWLTMPKLQYLTLQISFVISMKKYLSIPQVTLSPYFRGINHHCLRGINVQGFRLVHLHMNLPLQKFVKKIWIEMCNKPN